MNICTRPECQSTAGCQHRGPHGEFCYFPASPPPPVGEEMWRTGWNDAIDAMTTDRKIIWPYTNKTFGASNGSNEFTDAYWKGVEDYRSALIALKRQSGEG